jgi:hypothetical protein
MKAVLGALVLILALTAVSPTAAACDIDTCPGAITELCGLDPNLIIGSTTSWLAHCIFGLPGVILR